MDKLNLIHNEILDLLQKGGVPAAQLATLEMAVKGIQAFLALPQDETTGQTAQALADRLMVLLAPLLPALGPYAAVVFLLEAHLGDAIDWIGNEISPLKITDKQAGPIVHDDGKPAARA